MNRRHFPRFRHFSGAVVFRRPRLQAALMLFVLGGLFLTVSAPLPADADAEYTGHCDIRFFGTSTLHDFSGTVTSRPFRVTAAAGKSLYDILEKAKVIVEIKDMDTGNKLMNQNMYDMFEAETYPLITGSIADTPAGKTITARNIAAGDTVPLDISFHGQTNTVEAYIEKVRTEDTTTVVTGIFDLFLTDYGIEPPRFFLVLKVHDTVRVEVDVVTFRAEKKKPENAPSPETE